MKRIGSAVTVGTLALMMLLPATAAAHSPLVFWIDVLKSTCTNDGGEHGFGKIKLGMVAYAQNDDPELATPNYLVIRSKFQQKVDGNWVTIGTTRVTSQTYADGHEYAFSSLLIEGYSFESADHPRMRMIMRAEAWDDRQGGDVLVGTTRIQSDAC